MIQSISATPNAGNGLQQTFAFKYSSSNGATDLTQVYAAFNGGSVSDVNACYIYYNRTSNLLYLATNAGGGYLPPVAVGSAGTLSNSQCSLNPAGASVTAVGNELTLNVPVTFTTAFEGGKNIRLNANNASSQTSGWQVAGSWTVTPLAITTVTPASGSGGTQSFALAVTDALGATDVSVAQLFFNTSPGSQANACLISYERWSNQFLLLDNTGTTWSALMAGSANTIANSQCTLNGAGSTAVGSGNTLTITFSLTFSSSFAGAKNIYGFAQNGSTWVNWQTMGAWTVQTAPDFFVSTFRRAVYVAPNASTQTVFAVGALGGFTGIVNLSASVSPSGIVTASVSPASVSGSGTPTLTVSAPAGATAADYTVTITGNYNSGALIRTATIRASVQASGPYSYYVTNGLNTGNWTQAGTVTATGTSLTATDANGGSLISAISVPDGSSDY